MAPQTLDSHGSAHREHLTCTFHEAPETGRTLELFWRPPPFSCWMQVSYEKYYTLHTKYLVTLINWHQNVCFLIDLSWSWKLHSCAAHSEQATNQSYIICIVTWPLEMNGLKEGAACLCLLACSPMWQPRTVLPWQGSQLRCFVLWNQCIALALHIVVYMAVYFGILFANVATRPGPFYPKDLNCSVLL